MQIDWQKCANLVPVVVQDSRSNEILMLAYMNEEAFNLSKKTGFAHYFSRSKGRIWQKGESSGNTQKICEIKIDCDGDSILLKVEQKGCACHTGAFSCFFNEVNFNENTQILNQAPAKNPAPQYEILDQLYHTCLERKLKGDASKSYIAKLYKNGTNAYLKKICEEAGELCFALKDLKNASTLNDEKSKNDFINDAIYESADLLFILIVALGEANIHPERVLSELRRRQGLSGIDEKNSRKNN